MQLIRPNGFTAPCPSTALSIDLASLQALPVVPPPSGPMVTRQVPESQVSFVAPKAPPEVVDAGGKPVGQLVGFDFTGNGYAAMSVAGQGLALPVSGGGFSQVVPVGSASVDLVSYYDSDNCTGPPWFSVIITPASELEEVNIGVLWAAGYGPVAAPSAVLIGDNLFYAAGPFSDHSSSSNLVFTDPAITITQILEGQDAAGPCSDLIVEDSSSGVGGTPAEASLASYTAPFSVRQ
jgi:hypothetical protein